MRFVTFLCTLLFLTLPALAGQTVHVAAAISLKDALTDLAPAFTSATGDTVEFSFASSGALVAQVKSGAAIDIFISAAAKQMDDLEQAPLLAADTRRNIAENRLVLIVPGTRGPNIATFQDLSTSAVHRIAIGEPATVPAGQYALQVLDHLKLTAALHEKIIYGANVRQVLSYVERGEVDAGIVYATDAQEAGAQVKVIATADPADHEPIVYPAAILSGSDHKAEAQKFLDFLASKKGQEILTARGFSLPPVPATNPAP
jgi:molybdate transport system substrate-binding protein